MVRITQRILAGKLMEHFSMYVCNQFLLRIEPLNPETTHASSLRNLVIWGIWWDYS